MNPLLEAAAELDACCLDQGWRFCIIGGMAVLRWGDPRATRDVDVTVLTGFGAEEGTARALLDRFSARVPDPVEFAVRHRVLLLFSSNGTPLDVAFGALPFEERVMERSSDFDFGGFTGPTCSAEDLVVMKVFAGRTQDWADVENVIATQSGALDRDVVLGELEPLLHLKDEPERLDRLRRLLDAG